jgi:hypothetical protein
MEKSGQEQSEQLLDRLTQHIDRWGMTLPELMFMPANKPRSLISSQRLLLCHLLLCQPVLSFFYDTPRIADYADLLADRANIDRLVARLENNGSEYGNRGEERG